MFDTTGQGQAEISCNHVHILFAMLDGSELQNFELCAIRKSLRSPGWEVLSYDLTLPQYMLSGPLLFIHPKIHVLFISSKMTQLGGQSPKLAKRRPFLVTMRLQKKLARYS